MELIFCGKGDARTVSVLYKYCQYFCGFVGICSNLLLMLRRASFWVGNSNTAETVYAYVDYEPKDNEYLKDVKGCATYTEIKDWIMSEYGLKVSSLYVAQIKDKCGIEKRLNYNVGDNKSRVPKCLPEKEKAIMAAFKHFSMI